jgi:bacillolysin
VTQRAASFLIISFIFSLWIRASIFPNSLQAQAPPGTAADAAHRAMEFAAGGTVKLTVSSHTQLATFISASPQRPIPIKAAATVRAEDRSRAFLRQYGQAFGITDLTQVHVHQVQGIDEVGLEHVRLQQLHRGIPVTGGELTVHLRGAYVTAVNAKTLSDLDMVDTTPTVTSQQALATAQEVLTKHLKVTDATLSSPRLEVFNRGLLEDRQSSTQLAWFIEATKIDVREFIWVDAQRGGVLLHFSQLTDAKSRSIHDTNSSSILPGTLVRSEGGAVTSDADVDAAYDFSGDTYDYFFNEHGRDSYDNAGAPLISTVDYCPSPVECPYQNAFWNGTQMVYGAGFSAADDVDAHELTHAATEHSAKLFYYMQSGALNESFSDIFGETVDLMNTGGTDTPATRWQIGEDIPGFGAIRNMMDPTLFNDPGKVSDSQFVCETPGGDAGGVHTNSGVSNHAYALMVDGGTYNSQTIGGIGLTKAGKIQYRALTVYLLSGSGFLDNYNAVQQACTDLIGTAGITVADCNEVKKALEAVEMASPVCAQPVIPDFCPAEQVRTDLFFDNLETPTSTNWSTTILTGVNHWLDDSIHTAFGGCTGTPDIYCAVSTSSGQYAFWGYDQDNVGDSVVAMTSNVPIPAGGAHMQFHHSYGFEEDLLDFYDGGVIEYSTNNGATWTDAGSLITAGAEYGGLLSEDFENPLGGRNAFVSESFGYTASQLDLSSLAGQNVRFRFRIGTDESFDDYGWFIDDVRIYTCAAPSLSITNSSQTEGNSGTTAFTFTVSLSPASTSTVTVKYATANGSALAGSDYTALPLTTLTFAPGQTSKTVTVNVIGDRVVEPTQRFAVNLSAATGATIRDSQGVGAIQNDDTTALAINNISLTEGSSGPKSFVFTVTLTNPSATPVTVKYATANGSALAGSDYTAVPLTTLTFAPGQTSKTVTVNVIGDKVVEPTQKFAVNLSNATGATILDSQGAGAILNDDTTALAINNVSLTEGSSGPKSFVFTVTLTNPSATPVTVKYATANGSALAGSDYTALPLTTLTFTPGQTSKAVTVNVIGDRVVEPTQRFAVNLSGATGATILDSQGVGAILNDD